MHAGRRSTVSRAVREIAQAQVESGQDREVSFDESIARVSDGAFTRRSLLKAGAVAGAGLAVASTGAAEAFAKSRRLSRPKATPHNARVVVVGAGLAGVTATLRLAQQGVNVRATRRASGSAGAAGRRAGSDGQTRSTAASSSTRATSISASW